MGVGMGQQYLSANVQRYTPWFTGAHTPKAWMAAWMDEEEKRRREGS